MASSSAEPVQEEATMEIPGGVEEGIPEWVHSLLQRTYFGPCLLHKELRKNELNRYCITCDVDACMLCIASSGEHDENHEGHDLLKIYRHVYKDVVSHCEMVKYFNISEIQPYKCNKKWVVSLHPLPHCGSGSQINSEEACHICMRRLHDSYHYRFCCIACKVHAFYQRRGEIPPFVLALQEKEKAEAHRRKRKGTPQRAPFT